MYNICELILNVNLSMVYWSFNLVGGVMLLFLVMWHNMAYHFNHVLFNNGNVSPHATKHIPLTSCVTSQVSPDLHYMCKQLHHISPF